MVLSPAMNADQVDQAVKAMIAAETGCDPEQLSDGGVHVVARRPENRSLPEHRRFNPHPGRIGIVTLGTGAVVSVEAAQFDEANRVFGSLTRDEVFLPENLQRFRDMQEPGLTLYGPGPRFTCPQSALVAAEAPEPYRVEMIDIMAEQQARSEHSLDRRNFPHAMYQGPGESGRPTVFAAVAYRGNEVAGMAGVTRDSEYLWQIGIDVLPGHQGAGLAATLTYQVAQATFDAGAIPYYGTTNSNIRSQRTAISAGFRVAWVEVFTRPT